MSSLSSPARGTRAYHTPLRPDQRWRPDFWQAAAFSDLIPWLAPWAGRQEWPELDDYNAMLTRYGQWPAEAPSFRAVWQTQALSKPRSKATPDFLAGRYETAVIQRGEVPTRPHNWHDLFNLLSYAMFPRSKQALMARFWAAWQQRPADLPQGQRTRGQDALTILDEASAILLVEEALLPANIRADDRHDRSWLADLAQDSRCRRLILGHALYESLLFERPAIYAAVCVLTVAKLPATLTACTELADTLLAARLSKTDELWPPSPAALSSLPIASWLAPPSAGAL